MNVFTPDEASYRGDFTTKTMAEFSGEDRFPHHLNHEPQEAIDECLDCRKSKEYCDKHCAALSSEKRKHRFKFKKDVRK